MIPVSKSVKTVKKIINLPDPMVLDIDRLAIGDYSKRSGFVESAIRIYKRDLIRLHDELSETYDNSKLKIMKAAECQHEAFQNHIHMDYDNYRKYESEDVTSIGISLTEGLLEIIDAFLDKEGPMKNLQMFARFAVARELGLYEISSPATVIAFDTNQNLWN